MGVPQEPGRSCHLRSSTQFGLSGSIKRLALHGGARPSRERRQGAGGTGERGNELAGMGGRKSERLTVPRTRGNSPQETPPKGKGRRDMGPLEGTMDGTPSPENISPGIQRIAELRRVRDGIQSTVTQRIHDPEEPDAGNLHVRICGGPGRAPSPVYPTPICKEALVGRHSSRCPPRRFQSGGSPELNATIEKSIAAARRFDAAKVRADQLAVAASALADYFASRDRPCGVTGSLRHRTNYLSSYPNRY